MYGYVYKYKLIANGWTSSVSSSIDISAILDLFCYLHIFFITIVLIMFVSTNFIETLKEL